MSAEASVSVQSAAVPSNRFEKLLAAFRGATTVQEYMSHHSISEECSEKTEISSDGECLPSPVQSSPNFKREPPLSPEIPTKRICASPSGPDTQDCSAVVDDMVWDHTMSGSDDEESSDSDSVDEAMYDEWYGASFASDHYDNWNEQAAHPKLETEEYFEDGANNYEVDEVAMKLRELWSHDTLEIDENRNKIYDKWIFEIEAWERRRLLWLDERGKIEGFDSSCDKDRTFLVKVDNAEAKKTDSTGIVKKSQDHPILEIQDDNESRSLSLPYDLTSVYEYTNHNLWRKYRNCFKEGKYSNQ